MEALEFNLRKWRKKAGQFKIDAEEKDEYNKSTKELYTLNEDYARQLGESIETLQRKLDECIKQMKQLTVDDTILNDELELINVAESAWKDRQTEAVQNEERRCPPVVKLGATMRMNGEWVPAHL